VISKERSEGKTCVIRGKCILKDDMYSSFFYWYDMFLFKNFSIHLFFFLCIFSLFFFYFPRVSFYFESYMLLNQVFFIMKVILVVSWFVILLFFFFLVLDWDSSILVFIYVYSILVNSNILLFIPSLSNIFLIYFVFNDICILGAFIDIMAESTHLKELQVEVHVIPMNSAN